MLLVKILPFLLFSQLAFGLTIDDFAHIDGIEIDESCEPHIDRFGEPLNEEFTSDAIYVSYKDLDIVCDQKSLLFKSIKFGPNSSLVILDSMRALFGMSKLRLRIKLGQATEVHENRLVYQNKYYDLNTERVVFWFEQGKLSNIEVLYLVNSNDLRARATQLANSMHYKLNRPQRYIYDQGRVVETTNYKFHPRNGNPCVIDYERVYVMTEQGRCDEQEYSKFSFQVKFLGQITPNDDGAYLRIDIPHKEPGLSSRYSPCVSNPIGHRREISTFAIFFENRRANSFSRELKELQKICRFID